MGRQPGSDAWGLTSIRAAVPEADEAAAAAAGGTARALTESAYRLEALLTKPEPAARPPLIFLKTFVDVDSKLWGEAVRLRTQRSMMREIRVCSAEQPDVSHPNVCGISLATHAAAVEVEFMGFGHVGLRGRLPFVALEYCNGPDLWDVVTPGSMQDNGEWAEEPGIWALTRRLKRKLADFSRVFPELMPTGDGEDDVLRMNRMLDAAAEYQGEMGTIFQKLHKQLAPPDVSREQFLQAWSAKYLRDITVQRPPASLPHDVMAGRALRRLLELVQSGEWDEAKTFLVGLQPASTSWDVTEVQLEALEPLAAKHHEMCSRMYRRLGLALLGVRLHSHAVLNSRREVSYVMQDASQQPDAPQGGAQGSVGAQRAALLSFENALLEHAAARSRKARRLLHGAMPDPGASCPPNVAMELFRQSAEAIAKLHASGIVHGDIKAENFVLTEAGQVRYDEWVGRPSVCGGEESCPRSSPACAMMVRRFRRHFLFFECR